MLGAEAEFAAEEVGAEGPAALAALQEIAEELVLAPLASWETQLGVKQALVVLKKAFEVP